MKAQKISVALKYIAPSAAFARAAISLMTYYLDIPEALMSELYLIIFTIFNISAILVYPPGSIEMIEEEKETN
jgi:hypothetical protein